MENYNNLGVHVCVHMYLDGIASDELLDGGEQALTPGGTLVHLGVLPLGP